MKTTVTIFTIFALLAPIDFSGLNQLRAQPVGIQVNDQTRGPTPRRPAAIPTDEFLASLVADYKAYGLPLPPDSAELIVRKFVHPANDKQSLVTYDVVFRETLNQKTVIWAGCERTEPYQDFELETVLKTPTGDSFSKYSHITSLDKMLGSQSGCPTDPVLLTSVQCLAREWKGAGLRLLEVSRQSHLDSWIAAFGIIKFPRPPEDRAALALVAWNFWSNEFAKSAGDRRPIIERLKFLRDHRTELNTLDRRNVLQDMEATCAVRNSPAGSLESAVDSLIEIGADRGWEGRGFVTSSWTDQHWQSQQEKNAGFRQLQNAGLESTPVLLNHLDDFRLTRCFEHTFRKAWHVKIADIVGGMLNRFREDDDEFAFDSQLEEGRSRVVDPRQVLDWWVNVQRAAAFRYLQTRASQPDFGQRQPLDEAVRQTLSRHFPDVPRTPGTPQAVKIDPPRPKPVAPEPARDIHEAVLVNDLAAVRKLVAKNWECIFSRNGQQETPLHIAAQHADSAMVAYLLWHRASHHERDQAKRTALHVVNDPEIARLLIARGSDLNEISDDGTPLQSALKRQQLKVADVLKKAAETIRFEKLIEQGLIAEAQQRLLKEPWLAKAPRSGLDIAAEQGHLALTELLLKYGADPSLDYRSGNFDYSGHRTPFTSAVVYEHFDIAELLCRHKADMNVGGSRGDNGYDNLLHDVTAHFETRYLKLMLANGADVNSTRHSEQVTPLHIAAATGDLERCKLLVQYKAVVDAPSRDGSTPLQFAAALNHVEVRDYLLTQGAKVNFYVACALGRQAEVKAMLQADPTAINRHDPRLRWPPLFWAVDAGQLELVKFLIKSGADVNDLAPDKFFAGNHVTGPQPWDEVLKPGVGTTGLHISAARGNIKLTELLLEYGAKLDVKDQLQYTPLERAKENDQEAVVELLMKKAAQEGNMPDK